MFKVHFIQEYRYYSLAFAYTSIAEVLLQLAGVSARPTSLQLGASNISHFQGVSLNWYTSAGCAVVQLKVVPARKRRLTRN